MPIFYHQMRYIPQENKYVISRLEPKKNMDTTKLGCVSKYAPNLWVAKTKSELLEFAEEMKARLIAEHEQKLLKLKTREIEAY